MSKKEITFTFESDILAKLFAERLMLYLQMRANVEDIHVIVSLPDARLIPEIERLARGSYAQFKIIKDK